MEYMITLYGSERFSGTERIIHYLFNPEGRAPQVELTVPEKIRLWVRTWRLSQLIMRILHREPLAENPPTEKVKTRPTLERKKTKTGQGRISGLLYPDAKSLPAFNPKLSAPAETRRKVVRIR